MTPEQEDEYCDAEAEAYHYSIDVFEDTEEEWLEHITLSPDNHIILND